MSHAFWIFFSSLKQLMQWVCKTGQSIYITSELFHTLPLAAKEVRHKRRNNYFFLNTYFWLYRPITKNICNMRHLHGHDMNIHVTNIVQRGKSLWCELLSFSADSLPMVIWKTVYYKSAWPLRTHLCSVLIISTKWMQLNSKGAQDKRMWNSS